MVVIRPAAKEKEHKVGSETTVYVITAFCYLYFQYVSPFVEGRVGLNLALEGVYITSFRW